MVSFSRVQAFVCILLDFPSVHCPHWNRWGSGCQTRPQAVETVSMLNAGSGRRTGFAFMAMPAAFPQVSPAREQFHSAHGLHLRTLSQRGGRVRYDSGAVRAFPALLGCGCMGAVALGRNLDYGVPSKPKGNAGLCLRATGDPLPVSQGHTPSTTALLCQEPRWP